MDAWPVLITSVRNPCRCCGFLLVFLFVSCHLQSKTDPCGSANYLAPIWVERSGIFLSLSEMHWSTLPAKPRPHIALFFYKLPRRLATPYLSTLTHSGRIIILLIISLVRFPTPPLPLLPGNSALHSKAFQSSTRNTNLAGNAVDGYPIRSTYASGSCALTEISPLTEEPWWAVDLGAAYRVVEILIVNVNDVEGIFTSVGFLSNPQNRNQRPRPSSCATFEQWPG